MGRLARYLKGIGLASLITGAALGVFVAVRTGLWNGILAGLAATAGMGALTTLAIVPLDLFMTRKLNNEQLAVTQSRELEAHVPITTAFQIVRNALLDMPFLSFVASDEKEGRLMYKTRPTFLSFGEEVIVELKATGQSGAIIRLTSHPKVKSNMIDFGRNFKNAEEIMQKIKSSLKS